MKGKWKLEFSTEERYKASFAIEHERLFFVPKKKPRRRTLRSTPLWYCCRVVAPLPACAPFPARLFLLDSVWLVRLGGRLPIPTHSRRRENTKIVMSQGAVCVLKARRSRRRGRGGRKRKRRKRRRRVGVGHDFSPRGLLLVGRDVTICPLRGMLIRTRPAKITKSKYYFTIYVFLGQVVRC